MDCCESPADALINDQANSRLLRALRLDARLNSPRSREMLFYALCETSLLILLGGPTEAPPGAQTAIDDRGYSRFQVGTNIPLVLLSTDKGLKVLPAFSDAAAARKLGLTEPHSLLLRGPEVLELLLATDAHYLALNPGSAEAVELPRETVAFLVQALRSGGALPSENSVLGNEPN
ncbi:MAG: SseB family protein [Bdellovibrionales bacterium]|nr:SseB family protein [Bdellovibrionales bacterium]